MVMRQKSVYWMRMLYERCATVSAACLSRLNLTTLYSAESHQIKFRFHRSKASPATLQLLVKQLFRDNVWRGAVLGVASFIV